MTKNNESLEAIIKQRDIAVGALRGIYFITGNLKAKQALASIKEAGE